MAKVAYKISGAHESLAVGRQVTSSGDRCARFARFNQPIATFLISPLQIRSWKKGRAIQVAQASIALADRYGCTVSGGGLLAGARKRKKRRK